METLQSIAKKAMEKGKGILASDESPNSANKNLIKAGVEPTPENRRALRDLFINTPDLEKYISGIILHDETFWQKDFNEILFRKTLEEKDIIRIIKVDGGLTDFPESDGEQITLGLDDLEERLKKYYEGGARMAKWRSVFHINEEKDFPTDTAIDANSVGLAEYALFCQRQGIVPIVEPEVLLNGSHGIFIAELVTQKVLSHVFKTFEEYGVDLTGIILKTSMVVPGNESNEKMIPEVVAEATVRTLLNSVPIEVPGVVFLSGGQSPEEATNNLREIAKKEPLPWELAFSFLRAIEGPPAKVWGGKPENIEKARKEFIEILKENVKADRGL